MGEAGVQVKLLNAVDEGMTRRRLLPEDQVRTYEANALVGSGAVSSVLPVEVTRRLGLEIVDQRVAQYANGSQEVVGVTEPVAIVINNRKTVEQTLVLGDEVLIGQTVLETLDLLVDCVNGRVVPNPAHPDQTVNKVK
jgi:clan AA aspartic protease